MTDTTLTLAVIAEGDGYTWQIISGIGVIDSGRYPLSFGAAMETGTWALKEWAAERAAMEVEG